MSRRPPTTMAQVFFDKHWRWLETNDREWPHMTPIQGDWNIGAIGLPAKVLRKIYFDNARRLLVRSLPLPTFHAARIERDFPPAGAMSEPKWRSAEPVGSNTPPRTGTRDPRCRRASGGLWSERYLYLGFIAPYTTLTVFEPPLTEGKRFSQTGREPVGP